MSPPRAIVHRRWLELCVLCLALWVTSFVVADTSLTKLTVAFRIVGSFLVAYAWVLVARRGPRRLWLCPLLHLSLFALLFYAWFPVLALVFMDMDLLAGIYATRDNYDFIAEYVGSRAELLILGFSHLCLGVFALIAAVLPILSSHDTKATWNRLSPAFLWGATFGILCLWLVLVAAVNRQMSIMTGAHVEREILHAVPVVFSFLAGIIIAALGTEWRWQSFVGLVIIIVGFYVLVLVNRAQMPLLIVYSLALLAATLRKSRLRSLILIGLFCAIFLSATIMALVALRPAHDTILRISWTYRVLIMAEQKLFARQAISAGCFNRVANIGFGERARGNPFYFVAAVVPRILWPEKPNLSRGSEFAELCGETGAIANNHSESITILGEPILEAGYQGFVVAEVTLVILLASVTVFGLNGGLVRMLMLTALLPWLIVVEHHFALYIANAFKMALILVPVALVLHWLLNWLSLPASGRDNDDMRPVGIGIRIN